MATKAYFIINVAEGFYQNALKDLEAIPEVKSVECVSGTFDLVVKVEAPIRVIFVANKVMAKEWVKRLYALKVERFPIEKWQGLTLDDLIKLKRVMPEIPEEVSND